ncbi:helix-turn-helix domain-containing protein [Marinicauda salina]|uniref:helix-turn-helix domain-containing protein n=1 Tax=Marinicauda salina TaxID=2135793 RepID=UPI001304ABBD|nr:helix-turn-helix transcriptional regulator [Marinicauda salina]
MSLPNWSDQLRQLRRRLGVTQEALAAELGVSQALVSRWENGEIRPSRSNRRRLEALLANPRHVAPFERVRVLVEHSPYVVALLAEADQDLAVLAMSERFRKADDGAEPLQPGDRLGRRLGGDCPERARRLSRLGLFSGEVLSVDAIWAVEANGRRAFWFSNMVPLQTEQRDWAVHAAFRRIEEAEYRRLDGEYDGGAEVRLEAPRLHIDG